MNGSSGIRALVLMRGYRGRAFANLRVRQANRKMGVPDGVALT